MRHHVLTCLLAGALGLAACGGGGSDAAADAGPNASVATATLGADLLPPTAELALDASLLHDDAAVNLSADLLPPV